jgi:RHS Repeat
VTLPGSGGTVNFKYDPFGRRIEKITPSGTSIYAYDGDNLIEETDGSGTAVARYTGGQNIDEPLAMLRAGATSFYEQDGLGSVTSLTNAAGAAAQSAARQGRGVFPEVFSTGLRTGGEKCA